MSQGEGSTDSAVEADGPKAVNRLHCQPCKMTFSRSDSFKRHLRSKSHLKKMSGKVQKAKLGRPTKDAERKKAEKREKKARER